MVNFSETVKEKVFDQQLEQLVKAILGMGEYRLVDELSSYQVDPVRWVSMIFDGFDLNLSILLKECALMNVLSPGTL